MKKIMVAILSMFALAVILMAYETENTPSEAKYYDNAKVVRIKSAEGEGFVKRSYEEGYEEATANLPVFEKDTVGTTSGRLGIYLGRMNYLRLDSDTLVEMVSIPQLRETDLVARLEKGAIYLDIENLDKEKSIQIQTPDCGVFILDKGVYRINVDENSLTEVYVFEGIAEVAGQDNSRNVRENQKIVMARGKLAERPYYFYASEKDDFDRWNETQNREQGYARSGTSRYLQNGYEDYEYEMSRAGRWMYMPEFNSYVWVPYFSNAGWMPYANGRWIYNPYYGYVWTSYDNCGWFTHHYGRWHWDYANGWYWIPGYHWSPAWVSWFWDNEYYGWCPLSWWNRPIVIINNRWDRRFDHRRGIPRNSHSNIIIRKSELTAVNARRVALKRNELEQAGGRLIAYRGAAPVERVAGSKVTVINARGKAMTFKQNGIVSNEKYKISTDAGLAGKTAVYKYNDASDAHGTYSPRVYRAKDAENSTESGSGGYVRSKTGAESTVTPRVRSSDSNRSSDKAESKSGNRGSSTGSSSSSSSSSSSTREAKKKKDQAAYAALQQSENSAGFKSHALGMAATTDSYASSDSRSNRYEYRSAEARSRNDTHASGTYAAVSSSRFPSAAVTAPSDPGSTTHGYATRPVYSSRYEAQQDRRSDQNYSTFSPGNTTYLSGGSSRSDYSGRSSRSDYSSSSSRGNGSGSSGHNDSSGSGASSYRPDHSSRAGASRSSRSYGQVVAIAPRTSPSTVAKKKH